jgi:hypothetical protein
MDRRGSLDRAFRRDTPRRVRYMTLLPGVPSVSEAAPDSPRLRISSSLGDAHRRGVTQQAVISQSMRISPSVWRSAAASPGAAQARVGRDLAAEVDDEESSRGQRSSAASVERCTSRPGPGPCPRRDARTRLVVCQSGNGSERRGDTVLARPRPPRRSARARAARLDGRSNRQRRRCRAVVPAPGSRSRTGTALLL